MVDIAGGDGNADHSDHVLSVQKAAEKKEGDPDPDTDLGAKQIRRQSYHTQADATSDFGQSRWCRPVPSANSGGVQEPSD